MYKNQLQELAQRSCFNLPSYSCVREGPDHAPRFKATVNFNGETFESPTFCSTLRLAEHAAAEIALNTLANRGPSKVLASKVLDETGVYKNLLQETAHRAGINLPVYTTVRSGPGHVPVFSCTVVLAGMTFSGEPAKTKKQAQKNAAIAAWSALKQLAQRRLSSSTPSSSLSLETEDSEEQEQVVIARVLSTLQPAESQKSRQDENQRSTAAYRDPNQPPPSLYPMQYQSWAYSSFPTEMAMYQMWQQVQLLQLQNRLLVQSVSPAPPSQVLQPMQSDHHPYFSTRTQDPLPVGPSLRGQEPILAVPTSFYMPNKLTTSPVREKSTVTIREIKEDKTEESSNLCKAEVLNPLPLHDHSKTDMTAHEPVHDLEKQKSGVPQARNMNSQFRPVQFHEQTQQSLDSHKSNLRLQHVTQASSHRISRPAAVLAAPVMSKTVGQASSVGPRFQRTGNRMPAPLHMRTGAAPNSINVEFGRVPSHFMAPSVQIRSVTPVCSAPPVRNMTNSSQVGESSKQEVKSGKLEDQSAAGSEVGKLQM
ncbi:double-stranded RNA-binding protein 2-like [Rhododendron vialii]|uniref:double-stranded RNA-binding protein 2-like n=1 Tax=Rhododendron vialii TaxID=182163 RepID=UPI00265F9213|nr:double-stranded RNA-binding protein 2-like [Rhododendron vialii]XP_058216557.1 double-stranded RNA-binding protein 2-like [Rhododendron vialii]XP_058216558.1 double-stranded RNA-binding protein 2-like [Rhododendron vialii]XP_058216559.1 double-stranded RNA-binding protein 2-like [Rhododendron vialii]